MYYVSSILSSRKDSLNHFLFSHLGFIQVANFFLLKANLAPSLSLLYTLNILDGNDRRATRPSQCVALQTQTIFSFPKIRGKQLTSLARCPIEEIICTTNNSGTAVVRKLISVSGIHCR